MLERFFARIEEKARNNSSAPVLIVALGDSVTQGCMQAGVFDFRHVYHSLLKTMLEAEFPRTTFSVINAGVGGESAAGGLKRLDRDVIQHKPDLTLVAFCLNDSCGGLARLQAYRDNMGAIFQRVRSGCDSDLMAVTPNFMATRANRRIAPEHRKFADTIIGTQNAGVLKTYVETLKEAAAASAVPVADVHAEWEKLANEGKDTTRMLVNGLNHPDTARHKLAAETILKAILAQCAVTPA